MGHHDDYKYTEISDFDMTDEVRAVSGIGDVTVYQKADAVGILPENWQSEESLLGLQMCFQIRWVSCVKENGNLRGICQSA